MSLSGGFSAVPTAAQPKPTRRHAETKKEKITLIDISNLGPPDTDLRLV